MEFKSGLVLFQSGNMWFYDLAERWPKTLGFAVSAVPYPRIDEDTNLESYRVPTLFEDIYVIRNIITPEEGLTSSILFNILDDLNRGLKPPLQQPTEDPYQKYLEEKISSEESIKALINLDEQKDLAYLEKLPIVARYLEGCTFDSNYLVYGNFKTIITNENDSINMNLYLKTIEASCQARINEIYG